MLGLPFLAVGCADQGPAECEMAHLTDLPLVHPAPFLLTPASLDGQPTTMMLDTGSELTLITRPAAERLHLPLHYTGGEVTGIGGRQELYAFTAKTFRIGQLHGENLVLDAAKTGLDSRHVAVDGVFGSDFLARYDIDFDLPEKQIRLFKILSGCRSPAANLAQPLFLAPLASPDNRYDPRPHVRVQIGGVWLTAVVDSGAQRTAIFRDSARRLGLRLADLSTDRHGHTFGVGPAMRDEVQHIMAPIQIGEITISHLPVGIVDERSQNGDDMLLGLDFLARVHVWLSFTSHTMLMQYPPKPSPKLAGE